jgi:erythromycin esterase
VDYHPPKELALINHRVTMLSAAVASMVTLAGGCTATGTHAARSTSQDQELVSWIDQHAERLATLDPHDPLSDLGRLPSVVGDARIVGVGESTHGSREEFRVKQRVAEFLIQQMGFRTIAFEEDWASGVALDEYVRSGQGDPQKLVAETAPIWQTTEMLDLIRWIRSYNQNHADKVRILGTDLSQLRTRSFDDVTRYVRHVAPGRLGELERDFASIRLRGTPTEQIGWYFQQKEKQPFIDSARRVQKLVESLPATQPRIQGQYARQAARAILGWYTYYGSSASNGPSRMRDRYMADTITWWQNLTKGRSIYWAAIVHTAATNSITYRIPPRAFTDTPTGGYLRSRYRDSYLSIGTISQSGTVTTGWKDPHGPTPHKVGPPAPGLIDWTLGRARFPNYLINLRAQAPRTVRDKLDAPATMTLIDSTYDRADSTGHNMTVTPFTGAFDAIINLRGTSGVHLLTR